MVAFRLAPVAAFLMVALLGLAACSPSGPPNATDDGRLKVVATTTVLADMVEQVGGAGVDVTSIVPKGGVVETFDPSPRDIAGPIVFLCCDLARHITGEIVNVNGGSVLCG